MAPKRLCRSDGAELRVFWDEPMGRNWQCTKCLAVKSERELELEILMDGTQQYDI